MISQPDQSDACGEKPGSLELPPTLFQLPDLSQKAQNIAEYKCDPNSNHDLANTVCEYQDTDCREPDIKDSIVAVASAEESSKSLGASTDAIATRESDKGVESAAGAPSGRSWAEQAGSKALVGAMLLAVIFSTWVIGNRIVDRARGNGAGESATNDVQIATRNTDDSLDISLGEAIATPADFVVPSTGQESGHVASGLSKPQISSQEHANLGEPLLPSPMGTPGLGTTQLASESISTQSGSKAKTVAMDVSKQFEGLDVPDLPPANMAPASADGSNQQSQYKTSQTPHGIADWKKYLPVAE